MHDKPLNDCSLDELITLHKDVYSEFIKGAQPRLPKKMLTEKEETYLDEYFKEVDRYQVGGQYYFEKTDDGSLKVAKVVKSMACHAFMQRPKDVWRNQCPLGVSVYLPENDDSEDEDKADYYRWLAMESPYADFLYEQRKWGSYVIGDHTAPTYQLAAAFSMARIFSEEKTYPPIEFVIQIEKELGLSRMEALMYCQMTNSHESISETKAEFFKSVDGHTMFSSGYFDKKAVQRLLLGDYFKQKQPLDYTYFHTMWTNKERNSTFRKWFADLDATLRKVGTGRDKKDTTPDPFGVMQEPRYSRAYSVESRRKAFLIHMINTMKGVD